MPKRNFDVTIKDMNGKDMIDGDTGKPLNMKKAIVNACGMAFFNSTTGMKTIEETGEYMLKRYKLGMRLISEGEHDISDEESIMIKYLVSNVPHWTASMVGQIYEVLDA